MYPLRFFGAYASDGSVDPSVRQRLFWYVWNDDHQYISFVLPPLLLAILDLFVVLFLLLYVYHSDLSVYSLSGLFSIVAIFGFLCYIGMMLWCEFHVYIESATKQEGSEPDLNQRFTDGEHASVFLVTTALLAYFTIIACIDAKRG